MIQTRIVRINMYQTIGGLWGSLASLWLREPLTRVRISTGPLHLKRYKISRKPKKKAEENHKDKNRGTVMLPLKREIHDTHKKSA